MAWAHSTSSDSGADFPSNDLESDEAIQAGLNRLVDDAHAAAAELVKQLVPQRAGPCSKLGVVRAFS
jgi:hypothetical protein